MTASPAEPPPAQPATDTASTADRVAAAVLAVDGVVALHGGALGGLATYLPGRRVSGVRLVPGGAEVGVSVVYGRPVAEVAAGVRAAVAPLVGDAVSVSVGDVVAPDDVPARTDAPALPDAGGPA